ncbi:MAG: IS1380 family transposase [Shewanella sp.]
MTTLPYIQAKFNSKIRYTFDGGSLSSDTGLVLFREFDERLNFSHLLSEAVDHLDPRKSPEHRNSSLLMQKIYQLLAGYEEDIAADYLTYDPVFRQLLGKDALTSQSTFSRLFQRMDPAFLQALDHFNQQLLDKVHHHRKAEGLIIDLDSTHADTFGNQEQVAFNGHYQTVGFHPLVAFDGLTGDFLKVKLRPGNVYTSNGVVTFIEETIQHYRKTFPNTAIFVRADSGFALPDLYQLCEREGIFYIIRLKHNANLQRIGRDCHPNTEIEDITQRESHYTENEYQAASWEKARAIVMNSVREAGSLLYSHAAFVTNFPLAVFSPEKMVQIYRQRGTMENFIKEAKNGFGMDQMKSHRFQANQGRLAVSLLAYNFANWLKTLCFPEKHQGDQISTIRTKLIKVASKCVTSGRYYYYKFSEHFVYKELFQRVMTQIQHIQI